MTVQSVMMDRSTCLLFMCLFVTHVCAVDIFNVPRGHREKECYGTNLGFSFSGSHEFHYESIRRRFAGCTVVNGNLEVTNLISPNMTFDLSFLSTIKVVTGYVLLGHLNTDVIPLTSLRLIRADKRMKVADGWYSLIVVLTSPYPHNPTPGLTELRIPKLTEISQGSVLFWWNPYLCFVDTIDWSLITPGSVEMKTEAHSKHCGKCHPGCEKDGGVRRCWGAGRHMCQTLPKLQCDPTCRSKCFREGKGGCCDKACAVGCYGHLDTECKMCKYFRYGHRCIRYCPAETYPLAQRCIDF